MSDDGWKLYLHAAVPDVPPHMEVNLGPIKDGSIWRRWGGDPLLVRWSTNWDCGYETKWWYIIKDDPFDIASLKSKRRYEINKGIRNFEVKEIDAGEHAEELYQITQAAYATYPVSYRPVIHRNDFMESVNSWRFYKVYGAFLKENDKLGGYACLLRNGEYIDFVTLKTIPERERLGVNAAIIYKILKDHEEFLKKGGYICDGSRSVQHETAFQDYLEKYFGFRKAYCKLNIEYRSVLRFFISVFYPMRGILKKLNKVTGIRKMNVLFKMEEIRKTFDE